MCIIYQSIYIYSNTKYRAPITIWCTFQIPACRRRSFPVSTGPAAAATPPTRTRSSATAPKCSAWTVSRGATTSRSVSPKVIPARTRGDVSTKRFVIRATVEVNSGILLHLSGLCSDRTSRYSCKVEITSRLSCRCSDDSGDSKVEASSLSNHHHSGICFTIKWPAQPNYDPMQPFQVVSFVDQRLCRR